MYRTLSLATLAFAAALPLAAQQSEMPPTQLTIYSGNFAVARTTIPLDLHAGTNDALTTSVTTQLEPDSVVLRDPTGKRTLRVLEQNYDAGVINQGAMLQKFEGRTIDFRVETAGQPPSIVQGKIVRAGDQPLVEVNGHLQFELPGTPLFPASTDGLLLKPTLRWKIDSSSAAKFPAELDYLTDGFTWQATYNVVLPEEPANGGAEKADVMGWVTIQNNSGTDFPNATIQLMAGDVAKMDDLRAMAKSRGGPVMMEAMAAAPPAVTQKAFDDFHLYDLHRTLSLADRETKQVQFIEANGVTVQRSYQFEATQPYWGGFSTSAGVFGSIPNAKVTVREEILNKDENHLGMPLPAGRLRFYRRETTGQMQFVGESQIQHTPVGQTLHVTSGQSFDLTGERKQTDFHVDQRGHTMDESFAITLHNAKPAAATIHVIEHLNRAQNWDITAKSGNFTKQDSNTLDFPVEVPANGQTTLTYTVHYTW